jgi:hypothetical protein
LQKKLLGSENQFKQQACDLVVGIIGNEPRINGIQHLSVFKEQIAHQMVELLRAIHFIDYASENRYTKCIFNRDEGFVALVKKLLNMMG